MQITEQPVLRERFGALSGQPEFPDRLDGDVKVERIIEERNETVLGVELLCLFVLGPHFDGVNSDGIGDTEDAVRRIEQQSPKPLALRRLAHGKPSQMSHRNRVTRKSLAGTLGNVGKLHRSR